jgi:uncharacterized membrane protein
LEETLPSPHRGPGRPDPKAASDKPVPAVFLKAAGPPAARAIVSAPVLAALLAILVASSGARPALAQGALESTHLLAAERDFEASFLYPALKLSPDAEAELEISVSNLGFRGDVFDIEVTEAPEGWTTSIRRYNTVLSALWLAGEEGATVILEAFPPDGSETLPLGDHRFGISVSSRSGGISIPSRAVVSVEPDVRAPGQALTLGTSYPEIGGPSDARFAFSLDIRNDGPEDALVNLLAEAPADWDASFKPGYEDKQISSIHVPKGQSRSVTLDLTPAFQAEPGAYRVAVKAEQPLGSASAELTVNLAGTYKIGVRTANELLSASTEVGRPVTLNLFVTNEGSAPQDQITFLAVKPDDWKAEFQPPSIEGLAPRATAEVSLTVTPGPNALVGDYGLGLGVQAQKAQTALDFRITVKAGSGMAWLGAALVAVVVAGLAWTFRRLGRR